MEVDTPRISLKVLRGTTDGADCANCPLSVFGKPNKPVVAIGPEDPAFLIVGEGPGRYEVMRSEPFVGPSGEVVNKMLGKIGRTRSEVWITNATLCFPNDAPEGVRQQAANACRPRLLAELQRFAGKPILTLGAVAAREVIPKETLDAIDPPDAPKAIRKAQKLRQEPTLKNAIARRKSINKIAERRLKKMIKHLRTQLITEAKVKHRARPDEIYLQHEVARVQAKLEMKAREDAIKEHELKAKERELKRKIAAAQPKKPRKPKKAKISDIAGALFDVDVDGTGIRSVIPAIHPAAILRGGGASIGGSHTPDMAFINLIYDALKINALARGKDIRLKLNVEYELVDQERAIDLFLDIYRDAVAEGAMSIDLETYVDDSERHSALMAYMANIRVIGIATKKKAVSLAWELLPSWCQSILQLLLINVETTYHNGLYDRTVLRRYGFIFGDRWFDTLLAHHAAFPGNAHRLQTVASQFFGVSPWKSEFRNAEETPEKLAIYNANDTGATHALRGPLSAAIVKKKTHKVFSLDMQMSDVASEMHLAGMPVDREINSELLATFSKNVEESRRAVEDIARDPKLREQVWHYLALQEASKKRKLDPDDFEERYNIRLAKIKLDPDWKWKIGSGKHIAALLQAMSISMPALTASGQISTQKEVLESLTDYPVVRDILTFRENDKLRSTFVWQMFDRFDPKTGELICHGFCDENDRAHPIWVIHKISGRWASSWPVVSNVPKDKWKKVLEAALDLLMTACGARGIVIPDRKDIKGKSYPFELDGFRYRMAKLDGSISKCVRPNLRRQIKVRPGRKLVGFDFGQIEARVIALISGDAFLCEVFADPTRDIHIECARIIWAFFDTLDEDTRKQLRENVKNIEYGAMYMAQLETLHKTMLKAGNMIRIEDLDVAIKKLLKRMAGVVKWQHSTIAMASMPPYEIRDFVLGRFRTWPLGQAEGPEAVNFGVQTTAASIMNTGMARFFPRLQQEFKEAYVIAQVHDAAYTECWEDDAEAIAKLKQECFATEIERNGLMIPFPIEVKIGDDWSQV